MKTFKNSCLIALLALSVNSMTWAGDDGKQDPQVRARIDEVIRRAEGTVDSGGGNTISCWSWDGRRYYLADTYFSGTHALEFFSTSLSESQGGEAALAQLNRIRPGLGDRIRSTLFKLKFVFVDKKLGRVHDSKIELGRWKSLTCRIDQLAIQEFSTGTVQVNQGLLRSLTYAETVFLWIHEALIRIWHEDGHPPSDNYQVRALVAELAASKDFFKNTLAMSLERKWADESAFKMRAFVEGYAFAKGMESPEWIYQFLEMDMIDAERFFVSYGARSAQHGFMESYVADELSRLPFCFTTPEHIKKARKRFGDRAYEPLRYGGSLRAYGNVLIETYCPKK